MVNPPKQRGTAAETAVLRYVKTSGYPWAERLTLTGNHDRGDISLLPGRAAIIEVKAHATASTGQPGGALLTDWLTQTETERVNAGADIALLVVKRKGTTDPGKWFAYMPMCAVAGIGGNRTLCMELSDALWLLRHDGYGHPLTPDETGPQNRSHEPVGGAA